MKKLLQAIAIAAVFVCVGNFAVRAQSLAETHKAAMKRFETMINTNDKTLAAELIDDKASFETPASPTPLYGGAGYLSVVDFMREGFSDVRWTLEDMVAEGNVVAVRWRLTATHDGVFMGLQPTGKKIDTTVMNFYYFNEDGKIINDIAAVGMIGILRPLGLSR